MISAGSTGLLSTIEVALRLDRMLLLEAAPAVTGARLKFDIVFSCGDSWVADLLEAPESPITSLLVN